MIRVVALLILLGAVGGCASSESGGWTKPGATAEQVNRDTADCLASAQRTAPGREGPRRTVDQDWYRQCMANRGYAASPTK
jgi:hypothetical protein